MNGSASLDAKLEQRLKRTELINEEQLFLVHNLQRESPLSLAEALLRLDLLSAGEIDQILESLHETRCIRLEDVQVDPEAVKHVPRRVATKYHCIPIRRSGNTLVVAVSSADAERVREGLGAVTDFEIVLLIAEHDAVEHALFVHYGESQTSPAGAIGHTGFQQKSTALWSLRGPWKKSFESFYEHDGVLQARELAKQVASGARDSVSVPMLLIGATGSGKSHLLEAIKNYCMAKDPTLKGILCSGSYFKSLVSDYASAGMIRALRFEMRDSSILLLDDFGDAWGNEVIEEEIAATCAIVKSAGGAVIAALTQEDFLSGPKAKTLREFLEGGTEVQMTPPDFETISRIVTARYAANCAPALQEFAADSGNDNLSLNMIRDFALSNIMKSNYTWRGTAE